MTEYSIRPHASMQATPAATLLTIQEQLDDETTTTSHKYRKEESCYRLDLSSPRTSTLLELRKQTVMQIHNFWMVVLTRHPAISLMLSNTDMPLLRYLVDVDVTPTNKHVNSDSFELAFTFSTNPYFSNRCLLKQYQCIPATGRTVSTPNITWSQHPIPNSHGFFSWLCHDTQDTTSLGELIRDQIHPRAIELYLGTFVMDRAIDGEDINLVNDLR